MCGFVHEYDVGVEQADVEAAEIVEQEHAAEQHIPAEAVAEQELVVDEDPAAPAPPKSLDDIATDFGWAKQDLARGHRLIRNADGALAGTLRTMGGGNPSLKATCPCEAHKPCVLWITAPPGRWANVVEDCMNWLSQSTLSEHTHHNEALCACASTA